MPCCAIELCATSTLNSTSNPVANVFILLPLVIWNLRTIAPAGSSHEIAPLRGDPRHGFQLWPTYRCPERIGMVCGEPKCLNWPCRRFWNVRSGAALGG